MGNHLQQKLNPICISFLGLFIMLVTTCKKETIIESKSAFSYEIVDQNFTVPVQVKFTNTSVGAQNYEWIFEGGNPGKSNKKDPGVVQFDHAGIYTVKLRAWNEDNESFKEISFQLDSAVEMDFVPEVQVNEFSPVQVKFINKTVGASTYSWVFEGGLPERSTAEHPPIISFKDVGYHDIILDVSNGRSTFTKTKKIYVGPSLQPSFTILPSFEDDDYEVPFTASLKNTTISGLTYRWTVVGGVISNPTDKDSEVHFHAPGTYTVKLTSSNGKETKETTQNITVLPNTNLRTFNNVQLGINTAHETIGSFFSSHLRKTFKKGDDLSVNGKYIDFVYFGLNQTFSYNKFLSPDAVAEYTFNSIPQAMNTKVINVQEKCACGPVMSAVEFDGMTDDTAFQKYSIEPSTASKQQFTDATLPRIILYKTTDGRKAAIKIKQYVSKGTQSYIVVDIKVQKTP